MAMTKAASKTSMSNDDPLWIARDHLWQALHYISLIDEDQLSYEGHRRLHGVCNFILDAHSGILTISEREKIKLEREKND